jgi:hypothetical protein
MFQTLEKGTTWSQINYYGYDLRVENRHRSEALDCRRPQRIGLFPVKLPG